MSAETPEDPTLLDDPSIDSIVERWGDELDAAILAIHRKALIANHEHYTLDERDTDVNEIIDIITRYLTADSWETVALAEEYQGCTYSELEHARAWLYRNQPRFWF